MLQTLILLLSVLLLPGTAGVAAQSTAASGLKLSPVSVELTLDPGTSQTRTITVQNLSDTAVTLRPIASNFTAAGDGSARPRLLLNPADPRPANDFTGLVDGLAPVEMPARGEARLPVTFTAPPTAAAGGYYGAVRLAADPADGTDGTRLTASSGTIFLVTVTGRLYQQLSLSDSGLTGGLHLGRLYVRQPEGLQTRLRNVGNVHVQPFGTVSLRRGTQSVDRRQFNAVTPRGSVLPDSQRLFMMEIAPGRQPGLYSVETALSYGSGGQTVAARQSYLYLPFYYPVAAVLIPVTVVLLIRRRRRKPNALLQ